MPGGFRPQLADDPVASAMVEPCAPSCSGTRPTTPGSAAWWPRRSRPGWWSRSGTRTQQVVDELLDVALEEDRVDLLEAFAHPLPVRIICDLLGVPIEDQERFKGWSAALARGLDPDFLLTEEIIDQRIEAVLPVLQLLLRAAGRAAPVSRATTCSAAWSRWRTAAACSARPSCCPRASCCWWPGTRPRST